MCLPVIAAGAMLVGAAMSANSQRQQGQFAEAMANQNANITRQKSEIAAREGLQREEQVRAESRQLGGEQAAAMAASGAQADTGTFADMRVETAKYGEMDALTTRSNALRQAWGLEQEALSDQLHGSMSAKAGRQGAFSTLLTSGAQAYGAYRSWKKV